ncbi:MAG: hypothetical protein SNH63_07035 [Rikenellaceae bacterium]
MKNINTKAIALIMLLLCVPISSAVAKGSSSYSLSISVGQYDVKNKDDDAASLSTLSDVKFGLITLTSPDYSGYGADEQDFLDLRSGKSIFFGLNLLGFESPIGSKRRASLKAALSLMCYNYTFLDDITIVYQDRRITPMALDADYKKSKLTTLYLTIPVSLSLKVAKHLSLEPGIYAGALIKSHTKYKRPKVKSDYLGGLNDFVAGVSFGITNQRGIGIYCDYNLTDLFAEGRGPQTNAITFGLKF